MAMDEGDVRFHQTPSARSMMNIMFVSYLQLVNVKFLVMLEATAGGILE